MDATRDSHTESERERQMPCSIAYRWNLKYGTNEPIYKTADSGNRLVVAKGGRGGSGVNWESGVSRCKPLPLK